MKPDPKQTHVAATWKHTSPLISCRFDPGGQHLFVTAEDMTVQRFETTTGKKSAFPAEHDSWVRGLAFSGDGQTLFTGGFDGRIMWWEAAAAKPQPTKRIDAHDGWVRCLARSPDGTLLASGGNDHLVKVWNAEDGEPVRAFSGHEMHVYSVLFHPSGQWLLSGDLAGKIKQWDVNSGKPVREFDAGALHSYNSGQQVHYGGVRSLALSPDHPSGGARRWLAASGLHKASNPLGAVNEPLVLRFDWETGKLKTSHVAGGVRGIAWRTLFLPDGALLAASGGSGGGYLIFWQDDAKELHKLKLPNTARDMDLHPDGVQVATVHYDRQVRICRMAAKA